MKSLELVYGSINLEATCCVEIGIEEDNQNLFVCRLYTDQKNMIIFSFEDKTDAKIFSRHLWKHLKSFLYDKECYYKELRIIIQEALQDAEKEFQCKP